MNYCVKHNELCDSANASGYCSLTACNRIRYLLITDEAPTVEAISVEWVREWIYAHEHFSVAVGSMLYDWQKEQRKEE